MTLNQYSLEALVVRIQNEFLERPTLRLTLREAVQRFDIDKTTGGVVLDALVDAGVLTKTPGGRLLQVLFARSRPTVAQVAGKHTAHRIRWPQTPPEWACGFGRGRAESSQAQSALSRGAKTTSTPSVRNIPRRWENFPGDFLGDCRSTVFDLQRSRTGARPFGSRTGSS